MKTELTIKNWYLEDELSGIDVPAKEDIQKVCQQLNIPFTKEIAIALIYGDNNYVAERILPHWLKELN